jgi:hypothetical protein
MQRLVNAYSEHQKPVAPVVPVKEAQPVSVAQRLAQVDSVGQRQNAGKAESGNAAPVHGTASGPELGNRDVMRDSINAAHEGEGARKNAALASAPTDFESKNDNVICMDSDTPPKKVSGGAMQRMMSEASYFQSTNAESEVKGTANAAWPEAVVSNHEGMDKDHSDTDGSESDGSDASPSDPDGMLKRLRSLMDRSSSTQQALQDFDKKRGLPRSHSQTMVNSSRSRKQLLEGKIIAKWDGSPLISEETELGKPRPRAPRKETGNTKQSGSQGNTTAATAFAAV